MKPLIAILMSVALLIPSEGHSYDVEWKDGNTILIATGFAIRYQEKDSTLDASQVSSQDALMAYISGFVNCSRLTTALDPKTLPFSIPSDVSMYQVARILHKYLEDHPESLQKDGDTLICAAMIQAFPNRDFRINKS